ncbi:MAG: N-formylglutamate amidohydrolase [Flavobacteriaceae bacterium]
MQKLSVQEIIQKIKNEEIFDYVHYVSAAIHDGNQFRKELWDNCLHTEYERWFEEDPCTKTMVKNHPIVIAGCDSRFEYDLNRPPEEAVFETAWGKQLWKNPLSEDMKTTSLKKHNNFFQVVETLINKLENKFGVCIVYDMHSYNWRRWDREVPTWNLGTSNIDNDRFSSDIELWRQSLSGIKFPENIKSTAKINDTFFGNGYFLKFITKNFKNTLVLATEIAKVYCHEYDQIIYPEVITVVEKELRIRLPEHASVFYQKHSN